MLLHVYRQLVGYDAVHQGADVGVTQLVLGLPLELGLRQLHGYHRRDALPAILAGDLVVPVLEHPIFGAVGVQHPGQRRLEAGFVHTAAGGVDVVGKGDQGLVVAVVILQGDLRRGVPLGAGEVDDLLVQGGLVAVEIGHILPYAPLVAHGLPLLAAGPGIGDGDAQPRIQKRLLPHTGVEDVIVIHQGVKYLRVRLEGDGGAGAVCVADNLHLLGDVAPGEFHLINVAVFVNLYLHPLRQGIHHRGAHAMKAAGDLIAPAAELAAGVKHGVNHLQGRPPGLGLDVHGDAASVIGNGDGIAGIDGHGDVRAVAGQGLVDGVVHDLVHQVVQARGGGRADVHTGPLTHGLQALQHLDLRGIIFRIHGDDFFQF